MLVGHCISSLEKCLFKFFDQFLLGYLLLWSCRSLYILDINPISDKDLQIFSRIL